MWHYILLFFQETVRNLHFYGVINIDKYHAKTQTLNNNLQNNLTPKHFSTVFLEEKVNEILMTPFSYSIANRGKRRKRKYKILKSGKRLKQNRR